MSEIKWEDGAVCYADGKYLYAPKSTSSVELLDVNLYKINMGDVINASDFQLNTIKQGDCIAASELDTEQKYNDAVEVFELFGFKPSRRHRGFNKANPNNLTVFNDGYCYFLRETHRKLTYQQLMAIGKLKRLEIERDNLIEMVAETDPHLTVGFIKPSDSEVDLSGYFKGLKGSINNYDSNSIVFCSDKIFKYTPTLAKDGGENTKASRAYNLLKSMNIFYDKDEEVWYKKEYL